MGSRTTYTTHILPMFPQKKTIRNRRKEKLKRNADNKFTALTGIPVILLTGTCDCVVTKQKEYKDVPVRKIAYALANGWQTYEMSESASRMLHLRVKSTCGVDQCVNPEHLVGRERSVKLW